MKNLFRNIKKSLILKIREKTNSLIGPYRRKKLLKSDFTIISNNCWGGGVYRYFALPYNSPTVGLYFFADDYIKFIKNLKWYCSKPLEFITINECYHKSQIIQNKHENVPIARLGDVEIIFLHYKTKEEASEKWKRRCERINWDNLIIKFSEMNECTLYNLQEFDKLDYKKKVVFVTKDYHFDSQIIFRESLGKYSITDDTTLFHSFFNLYEFINNGYIIQK